MAIDCDVLVVGAGPAGLSSSLLLLKKGLNIVLLEKKKSIGSEKIKYDIIHGKTMDYMHLSKTDLEDLLDNLYQEDEVSDETLAYLENIISDYDKIIKHKKDNFKD